ncbi:MAG: arginyl-tRNA synthetase [Microgenomates group bacterium Gr01-1014_7]|nr:MAG: arginyl-tRNA synthetase [Microgenomates group bacterium Gr01-1014_7]
MLKQKILEDLKRVVSDLGYPSGDIVLSISKNPTFGDYSTNLALQLAKLTQGSNKQTPKEIAKKIVNKLGGLSYLEKAEVAGGGFINFFVKPEDLANDLHEVLKEGEDFGKSDINKGKKARVEFISANPTGPLHIGNARSGPLGDVIANILTSQGYEVLREFIDNNVGEQVKALGATIKAKLHGNLAEENQYQGEYIDELVKHLEADIENLSDEETGSLAVEMMHEEIMADSHAMGIKFDLVVHESELRKEAAEIIDELKKAGVVKEKDGALWLAPNDEFLKDRETVIQKSDGGYTYFTADIVYHKQKFQSGADPIIDIFGSNHHGHVPRLQAAVSALGFDPGKLKVVLYQYVRVKRGNIVVKMSKRAGNFITAREVLDEVGKDAFRFYLLRFAPQTHMDFDLELLKEESSKNPVFYVQYAHARMANILNKVQVNKIQESSVKSQEVDFAQLNNTSEINLIKHLLAFPDLVTELALNLAVHQLTEYAINLADLFHKFYENCPVLQAQNDLREARLSLVEASRITLANTLKFLGVSAPERM